VWIPGYWGWDQERDDFLWISGVWRVPPPGHRWIPGYWTEAAEGYQWISGFWLPAEVDEIQYLPYPPESLERGPAGIAPSQDHYWVSGCWLHHDGRYQWRPGYWTVGHHGWMWVPDHYVWTPRGAVYVRGRWDYRLDDRGVLFAPVYFRGDVASRSSVRFAPTAVINVQRILLHLFVRPDYGHYYFGDYYGEQFARAGFHPSHEFHDGRRRYDPLFAFYRWDYERRGVDYGKRLSGWHQYFENHEDFRPPHSLQERGDFVARHQGHDHIDQALLGSTVREVLSKPEGIPRLLRIAEDQRQTIGRTVDDLRGLVGQRSEVEGEARGRARAEGNVKLPRLPLKAPESVDIPPLNIAPELPDVLRNRGDSDDRRRPRNVVPERPRVPDDRVIPDLPRVPGDRVIPDLPRVPSDRVIPNLPRVPNVPRQIPKNLPVPQVPKLPQLPGLP
ncbi:MAG: YXWGXW repeat-containing protein, partial [Planctomycetia bacterium]|nr:YXWGXW repeat-containing protein [Planctomycetia bacterium]